MASVCKFRDLVHPACRVAKLHSEAAVPSLVAMTMESKGRGSLPTNGH